MSVASEITRIKNNIAAAYDEAEAKGATMPLAQNSANLANTIGSIPEGSQPTLISKTITANGTYAAEDDNADGYREVEVNVPIPLNEDNCLMLWDWDGTLVYSYSHEEAMALTSLPQDTGRTHELLTFQEWNWTLSDIKEYLLYRPYGQLDVGANYTTTDAQNHNYYNNPVLSENNFYMQKRGTLLNNVEFWNRYLLQKVNIPIGNTYIPNRCFNGTQIEYITIPRTVNNTDATGGNNFDGCYSLSIISLPKNIEKITGTSFYNCRNLKRISIPSVKTIEAAAFRSCSKIKTLELGTSLENIGTSLPMGDCYSLCDIVIKSKPILSGSLGVQSYTKIYAPRENLSYFESATNWSAIYSQFFAIEDNIEYLESLGFDVHEYKGAQQ